MSIDGLPARDHIRRRPLSNNDEVVHVPFSMTTSQGCRITSDVVLTRSELQQLVTLLHELNARFPGVQQCRSLHIENAGGNCTHYADGGIVLDVKIPFNFKAEREAVVHEYMHHVLRSSPAVLMDPELKRLYIASLSCLNADSRTMLAERYDETNYVHGASEDVGHPYSNESEFFAGALHRMLHDAASFHAGGRTPEQRRLDGAVLRFMSGHGLVGGEKGPSANAYTDDELAGVIIKLGATVLSGDYKESSRGMFRSAIEGALSCLDALDPKALSSTVRHMIVRTIYMLCTTPKVHIGIYDAVKVMAFVTACEHDGLSPAEIAQLKKVLATG